jgi:uncharacterized cupredoxin-like copper-binding protein
MSKTKTEVIRMKKHVPGLALLATATALFLSACGGGDSEPAAQEPAATAGAGSAQTIEIDATDFAFAPSTIELDAPGTYTFVVTNSGQAPHALEIDGNGIEQETETIEPGAKTELTVEITEAGEYEIYCPVAGHRDMGMEGTINAHGA